MKLCNNIRQFRQAAGMSQSELADFCNCSRNTISSIETYQFYPTAFLAGKICLILHKSFEEVFYYVNDDEM